MNKSIVALVIDDDPDDQEFFQVAVEKIGYQVECHFVDDCLKGLKLLENIDFNPDFIFVDVNMPKMNGLECLEKIRAMARLNQVPVYLYSTSNEKNISDKCLALGGSGLIKKETSIAAIRERLRCTFEKHFSSAS